MLKNEELLSNNKFEIKLDLAMYFKLVVLMNVLGFITILINLISSPNYTSAYVLTLVYSNIIIFIFFMTVEFGIYHLICFVKRRL